jgi:hypothetical protein
MEPISFSFVCKVHGPRTQDQCYIYKHSISCKECVKQRNHTRYLTSKSAICARVKNYREKNASLVSERQKRSYQNNKVKINAKSHAWYEKNSDKVKVKITKYRNEHLAQLNAWKKKYWAENRNYFSAQKKIYRQSRPDFIRRIKKEYARYVKSAALYFYSSGTMECALCGDMHFNHLCSDHIKGGGTQHRLKDPGTRDKAIYAWCKRNGYPPIFRVLCWNCNFLSIPRTEPPNSKQIRYKRRLKKEVLSHYSGGGEPVCSKCGNQDIRVLTIDHINNGGRRHLDNLKIKGGIQFYRWLKSNGFPPGYRVLCFNCNCSSPLQPSSQN